ncbi:hypothetical protein N7E02_08190 [Aliirhizobium terrae]|uniref:hypothetical protein n=1 Tax=Terrirhizobium terrae TaxID=2926709 RepID=UPI002575E7B9|nr:hypothetical protein [Rhizobium sp. CC-CFT758]WJH40584.1 hypothetical protein N7E02_08190 [Rhizobium sp. CC-CFT758]
MNFWGLRLKPSEIDRVEELLEQSVVAIGWSDADALLNRRLSKDSFRAVLKETYPTLHLANALEHTWRFIREIAVGDIALIPHGDRIHFVQVAGDPFRQVDGLDTDTVIRRPVIRMFDGIPASRESLPKALQAALAFRKTSANLSSVSQQITSVMKKIGDDGTPLKAVESSTGTSGAISAWRRAFEKTGRTDHGFSESTIWVEELGIWLAVGGWERDEAHRYWNGLGDRLGGKKSRNLIVEVNPPDGGPRGRWQGLAARDQQGGTWLLHSGEMNVGGRRVQLSEALQGSPVRRKLVSFADGDVVPYFVVAHLSTDPIDVVRQTARFTQACSRVRTRVTDAANPEFIEAQDRAVLLEESIGFTVVPPQAAKKIERVHARIWHALRDDLLAKGFCGRKPTRRRARTRPLYRRQGRPIPHRDQNRLQCIRLYEGGRPVGRLREDATEGLPEDTRPT